MRRKLIQLASALIYNANLKGFASGTIFKGASKGLCVSGLNCYSCPGAIASCPLGALQSALNGLPDKLPLYILGFLALIGLMLGRLVCGFLCPFGLVQELINKIPTPKLRKSRVTRVLSWLKYVILAVFVVALPLYFLVDTGVAVPAFCKYICPAGTLEAGIPLVAIRAEYQAIVGALFQWKVAVCAAVLIACVFVYRAFCRFLCPLGVIYSFFSRIALWGVRVDENSCDGCGACVSFCPMDIKKVGDHECIQCGACRGVCHKQAISLGGRFEKMKKSMSMVILLVALALAVTGCAAKNPATNPSDSPSETPLEATDAPADAPEYTRSANAAPDFTATLLDGSEITLSEQVGKIVLINFWATWCGPCVGEMPAFERLKADCGDELVLVAVNCGESEKKVKDFIEKNSYTFPVALDAKGAVSALYPSDGIPYTILIDRTGEVAYTNLGAYDADTMYNEYKEQIDTLMK